MTHLKRRTAVLAVAVAALAAAPSALAGVATYTNNTPMFVPHGVTVDSVLPVPSGRTAVQSIEVTGIQDLLARERSGAERSAAEPRRGEHVPVGGGLRRCGQLPP